MQKHAWIAGVALLVVAVGVVTGVKAFSGGTPTTVIENAENVTISGTAVTGSSGDFVVGGSTSDDWSVGGTLSVTGATTLTGALTAATVDVSTLTQGGGVRATSTSNSAETLLASDFDTENYIQVTPLGDALTLTLPATSTLSSFIPNAGDSRTIIIENAATGATTTTIVAGAGMDLQEPDGQNVVIGQDNYAILTFWRRSDTDMVVTVDEVIPAD